MMVQKGVEPYITITRWIHGRIADFYKIDMNYGILKSFIKMSTMLCTLYMFYDQESSPLKLDELDGQKNSPTLVL